MYTITQKYAHVKGFNIQPDWGRNGTEIWLNFDRTRYKEMIRIGKERFPAMNTVRIWLSFDAWIQDRQIYLQSVKAAGETLSEEGLLIIPTYFNGWFGVPAFGGFTKECVQESQIPPYQVCIRETAAALKTANILVHDVANEPFNNVCGDQRAFDTVLHFLKVMIGELRQIDDRPITVGTQSYPSAEKRRCDIDTLAPYVDVFSLHPYNVRNKSMDEHEQSIVRLLDYLEPFGKPVIATECCWATPTAEERISYLETELTVLQKYGIGFTAQGLFTSPVADLHPIDRIYRTEGLYMAFLDEAFQIRPYHDIFNRLFGSTAKQKRETIACPVWR